MENNCERVFAYTSAKVIEHEDLDKVSGGSTQGLTHSKTFHPTGSSRRDCDGVIDGSLDW
ncbi:hypothetical protein [Legionella hackeliae]|uniref:Uncharacterized protein n=1 Tax=Legionella hackeliae TaxID=449 RepID=A0A0A8UTN5_LEGHA|nr:hypothetical protein [Legionella hackeliae]KTD12796.1 hypothetical protein Lhac_1667 [Legionella hackeliae]CEK12220.1 conserved protein of unknown function [Legionella hackeliae]STX49006.1 Uncharacterised protein [Legionella hackeliae]